MRARPNLLFLLADQWRRQALSCHDNPVVRTPHLDRLASEGVDFRRCYATNPVCSPARATLQTGRYSHQTGFVTNNLYVDEEVCLAQCFRDAGYATGYIGKWHLDGSARPGFVPPARRLGYDYFAGFNRGHVYHEPVYFSDDGELREPGIFEPTCQTDLAMDYMKGHTETNPFFLMVSYGPPHMPYVPPEGFDRVRPEDLAWRPNVPDSSRADEEVVANLCGYYGLCEAVDAEIGRLLDYLDTSGLAENTIVVFTSDHGDMHGSHGMRYKGKPQEESLGIPLIVRDPGGARGRETDVLAGIVDMPSTFLSLCGVPVPQTMMGRDLSPALSGQDVATNCVYCEGRLNIRETAEPTERDTVSGLPCLDWRCVVTSRHKLAVDCTGQVLSLIDLVEDPYELRNLADDPSALPLREELLELLREKGEETGDPFPAAVPPARGD